METNVRLLVVCKDKKQTEKLYETLERAKGHGMYVDMCYYHGEEKAVMVEYKQNEKEGFHAASLMIINFCKDAGVSIKNLAFESGW